MFFYAYNRYTVLTLELTIFQKIFIILNFAYMRRSMYAISIYDLSSVYINMSAKQLAIYITDNNIITENNFTKVIIDLNYI